MREIAGLVLALSIAGGVAAEDQFLESDGVRIRYIVEGAGEPVVLLHGFGGNLDAGWGGAGITHALSKEYRVIALDQRGHGLSGKPHEASAYGAPMVRDVVRLLDRLKIGRAHVVGYSMGGRVALAMLAEHPERVRTAAIGGAGWLDEKGLQDRRVRMEQTAQSLERGEGVGPLAAALAPPGMTPTAQQLEAFNKMFLAGNDRLALAAVARGVGGLQPPASKLRGSKIPVLGLVGELDPNRVELERLRGMLAHVQVVVIPGAHHLNAVRDPVFLTALREFLAGAAGK